MNYVQPSYFKEPLLLTPSMNLHQTQDSESLYLELSKNVNNLHIQAFKGRLSVVQSEFFMKILP